MKKLPILILLIFGILFSCSNDAGNEFQITNMRINHYQNTGIAVGPVLTLLVQEGDNIGTDNWEKFYSNIEGFNYEPGSIYNISVKMKQIDNPPLDGNSVKYTLQKIISTEKVNLETPFDIDLKTNGQNFITTNSSTGYELLNQIKIDCNDLCDQLGEIIENQDYVVGTFKRLQSNEIQLIELE